MMIDTVILLSENEKQQYLDLCLSKIEQFTKEVSVLIPLFDDLNLPVPLPTYANFRDALFHFLKIRTLSDEVEVLQEIYAMEEHLHRSLKDTVISFFQNLSTLIESLIKINCFNKDILEQKMSLKAKQLLKDFDYISLENIKTTFKENKENITAEDIILFLLYKYNEFIGEFDKKDSYIKRYRKLLHKIKNECLQIRITSLSIERPIGNEKNTTYYFEFYKEIKSELEHMEIFTYIPFAKIMAQAYSIIF